MSLDSVVYAFRDGQSPESIQISFPALTLEQINGAIEFYLGRRKAIDDYLKEGEAKHEAGARLHERRILNCTRDSLDFARHFLSVRIQFLADADLKFQIVVAVRQLEPAIDFMSANEAGLAGIKDPQVLLRAPGGPDACYA